MTEDQADELRGVRGLLWGLVFSIPFYVILGGIGYVVWRMFA